MSRFLKWQCQRLPQDDNRHRICLTLSPSSPTGITPLDNVTTAAEMWQVTSFQQRPFSNNKVIAARVLGLQQLLRRMSHSPPLRAKLNNTVIQQPSQLGFKQVADSLYTSVFRSVGQPTLCGYDEAILWMWKFLGPCRHSHELNAC